MGYFIYRGKIRRNFGLSAIIILTIFDLYTFNGRLNYLIDEDFYKTEPVITSILKGRYNRFFHPSINDEMVKHTGAKSTYADFLLSKEVLYGNMAMNLRLFNARGYEGITLQRLCSFTSSLPIGLLVEIMGVDHFILYEKENIIVKENKEYLPRTFFFEKKRVIKDREKMLEYMKSPGFDPEKEVILEEEPEESRIANCELRISNLPISKAEIVKYKPNRVVIEVNASGDGFLFLSDTYYPGWKGWVDGKRTKIYKADYYFRAVQVGKGKHKVEFSYFPSVFIIGLIGSALSAVIIAGIWQKR